MTMHGHKMRGSRGHGTSWGVGLLVLVLANPGRVLAQSLRFGNHRDVAIPEYATVKIGPFYSDLTLTETLGYRYTTTSGAGTDFVFANSEGSTVKDGSEFPVVSKLTMQNYLMITRTCDIEFSASVSYMYFPLKTQANAVTVDLGSEGAEGNLSAEFQLSDTCKGKLYDNAALATDYVDSRGQSDTYGGSKFQSLENTVGLDLDCLVSRSMDVPITITRKDTLASDAAFASQESVVTTPSIGLEYELTGFLLVGIRTSVAENEYPSADRPSTQITTYETYSQLRATEHSQIKASIGLTSGKETSGGSSSSSTNDSSGSSSSSSANDTITGGLALHTDLNKYLNHNLKWSRSLTAGYSSEFETVDGYSYDFNWKGDVVKGQITVGLTDDKPSPESGATPYKDEQTGISVTFPLFIEPLVTTLSTSYDMRKNGASPLSTSSDQPVDTTSDYNTWLSKASTTFHVMKDVTCTVTFEHMVRTSPTPELSYGRDVGAIEFTYVHGF